MRVCLDTNVLVAAFATRGLCADVLRVVLAEHEWILGEVILEELRRVLRQKLRLPVELVRTIETVFDQCEVVPRPARRTSVVIRDATDAWVLGTAVAARADVLVTGDKDLRVIAGKAPLPVLDPRAFWSLLRGELE